MKEYTKDIHAKRVLRVLERANPCNLCPGTPYFNPSLEARSGACEICQDFMGVGVGWQCPCHKYGKEDAVKRAWIALEEGGYLE